MVGCSGGKEGLEGGYDTEEEDVGVLIFEEEEVAQVDEDGTDVKWGKVVFHYVVLYMICYSLLSSVCPLNKSLEEGSSAHAVYTDQHPGVPDCQARGLLD